MFGPDSWQRVRRKLFYHALHATWGRRQDAEDCVSDAVYKFLLQVRDGREINNPMSYLIQSVNNNARQQRRRKPVWSLRESDYEVDWAAVEDERLSETEERLDKDALLRKLKRYKDGRFLLEFYRTLRPSGAMRVAATRARRRMRKAFA